MRGHIYLMYKWHRAMRMRAHSSVPEFAHIVCASVPTVASMHAHVATTDRHVWAGRRGPKKAKRNGKHKKPIALRTRPKPTTILVIEGFCGNEVTVEIDAPPGPRGVPRGPWEDPWAWRIPRDPGGGGNQSGRRRSPRAPGILGPKLEISGGSWPLNVLHPGS